MPSGVPCRYRTHAARGLPPRAPLPGVMRLGAGPLVITRTPQARDLPTMAGAGHFLGSSACFVAGIGVPVTVSPKAPQQLGGIRRVTLATIDAAIPQASVTDTDGSVYVAVPNQPTNQAQWTCVSIASHASGGNAATITWPAQQKGHDAYVLVEDFALPGT